MAVPMLRLAALFWTTVLLGMDTALRRTVGVDDGDVCSPEIYNLGVYSLTHQDELLNSGLRLSNGGDGRSEVKYGDFGLLEESRDTVHMFAL
jgi:hypothetical protein